jgi:Multicopper oxidase
VPVGDRKAVTGKYVMHCHNLVHEDHDMMTQFETQPVAAATGTVQAAALQGSTTGAVAGMAGTEMPSMMVQWRLDA